MVRIEALCQKLRMGTRVIFVDKQPTFCSTAEEEDEDVNVDARGVFRAVGSCQVRTSWGSADVFIYQKVRRELTL
jgi:hypothetical protein